MKKFEFGKKELDVILKMIAKINFNDLHTYGFNVDPRLRKQINALEAKINKPHKRITIASAKAKGRSLQKWTVEKIAGLLNEPLAADKDSNNICSREMGQNGVDVWIHKSLREKFPISVECKAQEKIALPSFIEQAKNNTSPDMPFWLLVLKNRAIKEPVFIMDCDLFEWLYLMNK